MEQRNHNGGVSLRDHFDRCFDDAARIAEVKWEGHDQAHALIALALKTQADANEERLARMNEFRGTLTDQAAKFVTRETFETALKAQRDATDAALRTQATDSRAHQDRILTVLVALMSIALPASVAIAALILNHL
jgi:hypothetical protein